MRLRTKLFLISLLAVCGVATLALLLQRASTARSFHEYQSAVLQRDAEALAGTLTEAYVEAGNWPEVLRQAWRWPQLHPPRRDGAAHRRPPRHRGSGSSPPEGPHRRGTGPRLPDDDSVQRFWLFDARRQALSRGEPALETAIWQPLKVGPELVGYLSWMPPRPETHPLDAAFAQRQERSFAQTLAGAMLLALLAAWATSGLLLGRLRALRKATRAVAAGALETGVDDPSNDELGELARDFNQMAGALRDAKLRQEQWLADIAHELRTPLTVLRGEIEALQDGLRPLDGAALQSLRDEVEHLAGLVDDLHLLSAAESGELQLDAAPTPLTAWLAEQAARYEAPLHEQRKTLLTELAEVGEIELDPRRMRQVLDNLFQNLLRYADPGDILLRLRPAADQGAEISLADSGPGVSPAQLPQLFARLYRADEHRSRQAGGRGLGLAICQGIVQAHGGTMHAECNPQGGLSIHIHLPGHG